MKTFPCVICGETRHTILFEVSDLNLHMSDKQFTLVRCDSCKLVFLSPQPTTDELTQYYPTDYPPYVREYAVFSDSTIYRLVQRITQKIRRKNIHPLTTKSSPSIDMSIRCVLDFGCGSGGNLLQLQTQHPHWKLVGFDIASNTKITNIGNGITIINGTIDLLSKHIEKNSLDAINMFNVLEHLNNPVETLTELISYLKHGGEIIIEVPNIDSVKFKVFGKYFSSLDIPRHLFHFSPITLARLCTMCGLEVQTVRLNGSSKSTLRSIYNLLGIRKKKLGPIAYTFINILTRVLGEKRINTDVITLTALKR